MFLTHITQSSPMGALRLAPLLDRRVIAVASMLDDLRLFGSGGFDTLLQRATVVADFVHEITEAFMPFRDLGRLCRMVLDFVPASPVMTESRIVADPFIQQRDFHLLSVSGNPPRIIRQIDGRLRSLIFEKFLDGRGLLRLGLLKPGSCLAKFAVEFVF